MTNGRMLRALAISLAAIASGDLLAQPRAAACFYSADFETIDQFSGWGIGDFVATQTPDGDSLGGLVPAWVISNADPANADAYFPVPDQPIGNRFVVANDAAVPCNCTMNDVALVTPAFDFSALSGVALECRVFNEGTLGAGPASIEGNFGGGSWIALATIPSVANDWQPLFVNLTAFDGQQDVRIRFRWSDGGGWASGFAMDDFCLRERSANDVSVTRVFIGDPSVPEFDLTIQSFAYRQLPVDQSDSLLLGMEITNRGTAVALVNALSAQLFWNGDLVGALTGVGPGELAPGARSSIQFASSFIPPGTGTLAVIASIPSEVLDDDVTDNMDSITIQYTGPGWDAGYGAMALDNGSVEGYFGSTENFVLANRMEIVAEGSTARGVSVVLSGSSTVGEAVRGLLVDANLAFLDTSTRHIITQQDLDNSGAGIPLYLSFSEQSTLSVGDHFVGIQHLNGNDDGRVEVAMGGAAQYGSSILQEGFTFDLSYVRTTPMVRLHLDDVDVGIEEPFAALIMGIFPVPANQRMTMLFDVTSALGFQVSLFDAVGKEVYSRSLGVCSVGMNSYTIELGEVVSGVYMVVLSSRDQRSVGSVEVIH